MFSLYIKIFQLESTLQAIKMSSSEDNIHATIVEEILEEIRGKVDGGTFNRVSNLLKQLQQNEETFVHQLREMLSTSIAQQAMQAVVFARMTLFMCSKPSQPFITANDIPMTSMSNIPEASFMMTVLNNDGTQASSSTDSSEDELPTQRRSRKTIKRKALTGAENQPRKAFADVRSRKEECKENEVRAQDLQVVTKKYCRNGVTGIKIARKCPNCSTSFVETKNWISNLRKHLRKFCPIKGQSRQAVLPLAERTQGSSSNNISLSLLEHRIDRS